MAVNTRPTVLIAGDGGFALGVGGDCAGVVGEMKTVIRVTVVEKRRQARDHPVVLGVPETYYLKCFVLRRLD